MHKQKLWAWPTEICTYLLNFGDICEDLQSIMDTAEHNLNIIGKILKHYSQA